jgi:DNA-binding GntR family transcriptional regulator
MADQSGPRSLSRAVFANIRADIVAGTYLPGSKLSPREIATKSNVSLSVVREALTRLAEQGLVIALPQLGFSVVNLDLDDARDLNRVRILIESAAIKDAVEHADVEYETRVLASHHRLTRTPQWADATTHTISDAWAQAHTQFHSALLSSCSSPRLIDLAAGMRETAELYRRWSGRFTTRGAQRDVAGEHLALMQAALDRDAERAAVLAGEHIDRTTEVLTDYAEQHADEARGDEVIA